MNYKEFHEDFSKNVKPQIEEILKLLKIQHANNVSSNIEAAAAKIITELKAVILDCPCNKEILKALAAVQGKVIITVNDEIPNPNPKVGQGKYRYSYPNFLVGNEEMGTGKNPNSLTWPFGVDDKST